MLNIDWTPLVAGPRVWNSLPAPLRDINSIYSFRQQLKTFLFSGSDYVFARYKYSYLLIYLLTLHSCTPPAGASISYMGLPSRGNKTHGSWRPVLSRPVCQGRILRIVSLSTLYRSLSHSTWVLVAFRRNRLADVHASTSARQHENLSTAL